MEVSNTCFLYYIKHKPFQRTVSYQIQHRLGIQLLSAALTDQYGIHLPPAALEGTLSKGPYGKPYLPSCPEIHFNISHCPGMVACALSAIPIGIDIDIPRRVRDSVKKKVLTSDEVEYLKCNISEGKLSDEIDEIFIRYWTLKESLAKCTGLGMNDAVYQTSFFLTEIHKKKLSTIPSSDCSHYFKQILLDNITLSLCSAAPLEEIIFCQQK